MRDQESGRSLPSSLLDAAASASDIGQRGISLAQREWLAAVGLYAWL